MLIILFNIQSGKECVQPTQDKQNRETFLEKQHSSNSILKLYKEPQVIDFKHLKQSNLQA